ncbi:unnamed protein product [Dracunculus medinensis]|uniref:RT_RNaseH_2 domain-containing protein n=1 Tax=Dracunculus medinensis TaxID=318479 RepID=A0A0N4UE32_DRAME|nr:unnamed protein product [Dracunculus medinensis]
MVDYLTSELQVADKPSTLDGNYPIHRISDTDQFWKLECLEIHEQPCDYDDERALEQFKENTVQINGKYQTRQQEFEQYHEIIKDQLRSDIIEKIEPYMDQVGAIHYLPHHNVLTPDKETIKLRIIYDASAHVKRSKSLNDLLYRGPIILPDMEASMNIREFLDVRFNEIIPDHDLASLNARKILVIMWSTKLDIIHIILKQWTINEFTKRNILQFVASQTHLPRFITNLTSHMNFNIFTDASSMRYTTAIYTYREGMRKREPYLVYAKSRIAPMKGMTIPRLELLAILIGVQAGRFILN